jgi:hypothetical protein
MSDNPSDIYHKALQLTKNHHASQSKTFSGQFTWKNRHRIKDVIDRFNVKSILDYGCGGGKQYRNVDDTGQNLEQYWGIKTTKYDPGVPIYAKEPTGSFDLVLCIQVLGSIPKNDLSWVVDRLYNFANKAVFVSERLGRPRKKIYESIEGDMPYDMSKKEWMDVLTVSAPHASGKTMLAAFKGTDGWEFEEIVVPVSESVQNHDCSIYKQDEAVTISEDIPVEPQDEGEKDDTEQHHSNS